MFINQIFKGGLKGFRTFAKKRGLDNVLTDQLANHLNYYQNQYLDPKTLGNLTVDAAKGAIRRSYSEHAKHQMGMKLDEALVHSAKNIPNHKVSDTVFGFYRSHIDSVSETVDEARKKFLGDWERSLEQTDGRNGLKVFSMLVNQPGMAKKNFGIEGLDVFRALHTPETATTPFLKNMGTTYRQLDKQFVKSLQQISPLGDIPDYVVSLKPNPHIAESLGVNRLAALYEKYTLLNDKQAKTLANDYLAGISYQNRSPTSVVFPQRGIKFRPGEQGIRDQYSLWLAINGIKPDDPDVLARVLRAKELTLQKAYFYHKFGTDPVGVISEGFKKHKGFAKSVEDVRDLAEKQKVVLKRLEIASGFEYAEYNALKYMADGANKFISALYGASGSKIRNVFLDYTKHPTSIRDAFISQEGPIIFYHNRFLKPLQATILSGLSRKFRNSVNDVLNVMDFAQTNTSLFHTMGLKQENFMGDVFDSLKKQSVWEKAAQTFDKTMGRFNNFIHGISGNIAHFDTTTAVNVYNTAAAFSNLILKSINYDEFMRGIGPLGKAYLSDLFGIGKNEFLALKEAYSAIKQTVKAHEVKRVLGFDDIDILLPSQMNKMPDSIALKYRKPFETVDQFKARVRIAYNSLLTNQRNLAMTTLHRSNRFVEQGLQRGTFIDTLLRPFTQFANIEYGQQYNLRVGMAMSLYGTPFNINFKNQIFNKRGALAWGKALGFYGAGAMMTVSAKDILQGRQPREWTPGQLALVFAGSGVGGIPLSIIAESFYAMHKKSGFYSTTPLGSFLEVFGEAFDFGDPNQAFRFAKALQSASGVGRLWYTRGFIDKLMRDSLLDDRARQNMETWYREEMRSPFVFEGD